MNRKIKDVKQISESSVEILFNFKEQLPDDRPMLALSNLDHAENRKLTDSHPKSLIPITEQEKEQLLIYREELQRKTRFETNSSLLSFDDIAVLTGYSATTVKNDLTKRPGFPSPIMGKKFKCAHVKLYLNQASQRS